jgi:hypothetical protein
MKRKNNKRKRKDKNKEMAYRLKIQSGAHP